MMDFAAYETAFRSWIEAQLPEVPVQYSTQKGGWQGTPRARINILASLRRGYDDTRWIEDGDQLTPTFEGHRELTCSVEIRSRDQRLDKSARYYLEKLRTSIRKPSVQDLFTDAGLAYQTTAGVVNLDEEKDGRIESVAVLDFIFNAIAQETDADEALDYVETNLIESTIDTPAGDNVGWSEDTFGG